MIYWIVGYCIAAFLFYGLMIGNQRCWRSHGIMKGTALGFSDYAIGLMCGLLPVGWPAVILFVVIDMLAGRGIWFSLR